MARFGKRFEKALQIIREHDGAGSDLARRKFTIADQRKERGAANAGGLGYILDGEADFVVHGLVSGFKRALPRSPRDMSKLSN